MPTLETASVLDLRAMPDQPPGDGPILEGEGSSWLPPPDDDELPPSPTWVNGRAFPAAWRETLEFGLGGFMASARNQPRFRPGGPWNHRPPPNTEADIDQAISAKVHISMRLPMVLANAQLAILEPAQLRAIPDWKSADEAMVYAADAVLPKSPIFLDFESAEGHPVVWEQDTWPLPFHLRGALCWQRDDLLCIVPFGSVGGRHPWGGTDYQAWARWIYVRGDANEWPAPGPGDFIARASGEARCWVDLEAESICTQQGRVAHNLNRRVLSALMCLEAFEVELVPAKLSRQVRRSAERKGEGVGLVPRAWPLPVPARECEDDHDQPETNDRSAFASSTDCPIPKTHARLDQSHALWHESLDSYAEPDRFVGRLNALIQALRSVTFVLQKELRHKENFDSWYLPWQERMRADKRMTWLVSARNKIEKEGDLDTHSVAHVRVVGDWRETAVAELDVDPTSEAHDIARRVSVLVPPRSQREDTLVVERLWTVEELANDEILDTLAHCYGFLFRLVAAVHEEWGDRDKQCILSTEGPCGGGPSTPHPSGRMPCMVASRESRTARRDLQSGAPVEMGIRPLDGPAVSKEEVEARYGSPAALEGLSQSASVFDLGHAFHEWGRKVLLADGYHSTFAWLLTADKRLVHIALYPEDHREKYLGIEQVALEADRLGAEDLIFTTEVWEAPAVKPDDPRAEMRATEREDRQEVFLTVALGRDGKCREWRTRMSRTESGDLELAEMHATDIEPPLFLAPVIKVWDSWTT
jgi:hypothetical protein